MGINQKQPNVLFVFSDQHRWCDLGCYGNSQVKSPNLDAFAEKATRFNNCISNSPVCVPARGSLLTGLFPLRHGAITNDLAINHNVKSIAHVLSESGYHTGYIGKWHLAGIPRDGFIAEGAGRLGFDEWKVCNCCHDYMNTYYYDEENHRVDIDGYGPAEETNLAVDFIKRNNATRWSLVLSWSPPHDPYTAVPKKYLELYKDKEIKLRENVPNIIKNTLKHSFSKEEAKENYKGYYAHITALDEQFGRLIKTLEETAQIDNTIVVYTSDHGDMLGSQGFTNKQLPYEESIKVPLLVYWKGKTVTLVSEELIGLVDLPMSILGLIGASIPGEVDGKDLHSLFIDRNAKGQESCYIFDLIPCHQATARGGSEWRGIRTKEYTYARSASDDGMILYDNINDPYQLDNLVARTEYEAVKACLMTELNNLTTKHDKLLPWEELIREYGLREEWNKSQAYFHLPLLD